MSTPVSGTLPAGTLIAASVSGSFQTLTNNAATFREKFLNALPFNVRSLDVQTRDILSNLLNLDVIDEPYTASVTFTLQAAATHSQIIGGITTAATSAGSYQPAVTLTSEGEAAQNPIQAVGGLIGTVLDAAGNVVQAAGNLASEVPKVPGQLSTIATLLIVGIVGIVALVAFGPNLKGVGSNIRV